MVTDLKDHANANCNDTKAASRNQIMVLGKGCEAEYNSGPKAQR
jgi:hypothetical protein